MKEESTTIVVQVQPNARQNKVVRFGDGVLHLRISAPATKGKANKELLKLLSGILGVPKTHLIIERGMTSKKKTIVMQGLTQDEAEAQLERHRMTAGM